MYTINIRFYDMQYILDNRVNRSISFEQFKFFFFCLYDGNLFLKFLTHNSVHSCFDKYNTLILTKHNYLFYSFASSSSPQICNTHHKIVSKKDIIIPGVPKLFLVTETINDFSKIVFILFYGIKSVSKNRTHTINLLQTVMKSK